MKCNGVKGLSRLHHLTMMSSAILSSWNSVMVLLSLYNVHKEYARSKASPSAANKYLTLS
jgi:hypothetical protein